MTVMTISEKRGPRQIIRNPKTRKLAPLLVILAILGTVLALGACAALQANKTSIVHTLAVDAGYAAYRAMPNARVPLSGLCLLQDSNTTPAELQARFKELLGEVWIGASDMDATLVVLSLNNLVGMIGLLDEPTEGNVPLWREAIRGICEGSGLAGQG